MKIAVNTRLLLHDKLEGIGWYTHQILQRLVTRHPEVQFYFLFDRPYHKSFLYAKNVTPIVLPPQARHPLLWKLWFDVSVAAWLKRMKPDVFYSPDGYLSLKADVRQVPVIHDVNFEVHPELLPKSSRKYYQTNFPKFARKAQHILTVSEFSKAEIKRCYGILDEKITVTGNAPQHDFSPTDDFDDIITRQQHTGGAPYFLYVGSLNPRKNLLTLIEAFAKASGQLPSHKLVLAGKPMFGFAEIEKAIAQSPVREKIIQTGALPTATLGQLLGAAEALIAPSVYEGFGMPLVEAFSAGTPVIASQIGAFEEVGQDAALYAPPRDAQAFAQAMVKLANEPELRKSLIAKGLARSTHFTWEKVVDVTEDVLFGERVERS